MKIHESITAKKLERLVRADDNVGLCVYCGAVRDGCEPDARKYPCEACKLHGVYGAEELLFYV